MQMHVIAIFSRASNFFCSFFLSFKASRTGKKDIYCLFCNHFCISVFYFVVRPKKVNSQSKRPALVCFIDSKISCWKLVFFFKDEFNSHFLTNLKKKLMVCILEAYSMSPF